RKRCVAGTARDASTLTEPECLGPCDPGTTVCLEGIVWHETSTGLLVVNVAWRNKTYVGTLLDCTKHDWAPPRFCESPVSDVEARGNGGSGGGRGRGKRTRATSSSGTPGEPCGAGDAARAAVQGKGRGGGGGKGRRGNLTSNGHWGSLHHGESPRAGPGGKRKGRPSLDMQQAASEEGTRPGKRLRLSAARTATAGCGGNGAVTASAQPDGGGGAAEQLGLDCPHPNCNKKYRHINGLKYHQAHAHLENEDKAD
uniref:C2H2-type domain-containing protein n=1 Tax=Petromyzon marinus TaxID=7757 RepID=S4R5P0_PETMA